MKKKIHIWSQDEKAYLKEITPGRHYYEIVKLMNERFNYEYNNQSIKNAIGRYKLNTGFNGRFKKGDIPVNKGTKGLTGANRTSFKKGNKPLNHKPVGSERVNVDGYVEIKVAEPSKWRLKHRVLYEQHKGEIPKGHNVIFGDGNKLNIEINNLVLVSQLQLLVMNKNNLIKTDTELTKTGAIIAELIMKIREKDND